MDSQAILGSVLTLNLVREWQLLTKPPTSESALPGYHTCPGEHPPPPQWGTLPALSLSLSPLSLVCMAEDW